MGEEKSVRIYTLSTCPTCKKAKRFLEKSGITYENLDVGESKAALEELFAKSNQLGVPVIEIDGEILLDFNQKEWEEKLGV